MKRISLVTFFLFTISFSLFCQSKFEKAQKYEQDGNYVYSLSLYYELILENDVRAQEKFDKLKSDILSGNFGIARNKKFEIYDTWIKNMKFFEKYCTEHCIYEININNLEEESINYKNKTYTFKANLEVTLTDIFIQLSYIFLSGYKNAYENNWETDSNWPYISCNQDISKSIIDGSAVININGINYTAALYNDKLYEFSFSIADENNKILYKGNKTQIQKGKVILLENLNQDFVDKLDEKKLHIIPTGIYLRYGKSDTKSLENSEGYNRLKEISFDLNTISFNKDSKTIVRRKAINLWTYTDEVPEMLKLYKQTHPEFDWVINTTIISTLDGLYQPTLDCALFYNNKDAPDIFVTESGFTLKYSKGDMQEYSMPYEKLGIDIKSAVAESNIAQYTIDIGSNSNNEIDALSFQSTAGAFIYRRSIAKKVLGTDNPKEVAKIIGAGTGKWDKFLAVGKKMNESGYAILSGINDLWLPIENSAQNGWIKEDKLYLDPKREEFLDIAKQLTDNNMTNNTIDWQDAWFADMKSDGYRPCFGYFGPAWLVNYVLAPNCGGTRNGEGTFGDWAVCPSPVGFYWGGSYIHVNSNLPKEKKEAVREIIEWITLDTSENGLQYKWATGELNEAGTKDSVSSNVVMQKANGNIKFLKNQNMFEAYIQANKMPTGKNKTPYDETINNIWINQVRAYASGAKSREEAISDFKTSVEDKLCLSYW